MVERSELGDTLIRLRQKHGVKTQRALIEAVARHTGVKMTTGHIGNVEAGHVGMSRANLEAIAVTLDLDDDECRELLLAGGYGGPVTAITGLVERIDRLETGLAELTMLVRRLVGEEDPPAGRERRGPVPSSRR